jgi:ribosomal-protein-alanine N-acetyltransferase
MNSTQFLTVLETDNLILREFTDSDVDPLYAIQGDRQHMRLTVWVESRQACEAGLRRYARNREMHGFAPWTVVHRAEGRVIGWGGLGIDPDAPQWGPEVSYFIHPLYQGRGFATELVLAALRHGFCDVGLLRIGAFARPENLASVRVLEKCGFALVQYEPALQRNRYEARREGWADGA